MYIAMGIIRKLHHFLVPHTGNNHRAKALHHEALLAYVLVFAVFNLAVKLVHKTAPGVLGYATDIRVERLLEDTNAKRAEAGLPALILNETLSQAAAGKAADMFANNYWAHNSPQGKTPWDFILAAGYSYTLAGENLAKNFDTSDGVVDAWMASPTHKANIVKDGYQDVGFAVVNGMLNGEETTLVVQMFGVSSGRPIAQVPKAEAAAPQVTPVPEEPTPSVVEVPEAEPVAQVTAAPVQEESRAGTLPVVTFGSVSVAPVVNITSLTHAVVYVFTGLIIGVLAIDAYVVSRKKLVRLTGHNVAHILFLGTVFISGLAIARGSLI